MPVSTPASAETSEQRLRRLSAELRERLLAGQTAAIEEMLDREPHLAEEPDAVLELLYCEFLFREAQGVPLSADEWQRRFPQWHERLARLIEVHRALHGQAALETAGPAATHADGEARPSQGESPDESHIESGRYELLEEIGRGGMGVVYKARQLALDRTVALKMILAGEYADPAERRRFVREAQLAARLTHPQIVQVYDVGELEGRPYLAMEYVPGRSLAERLADGPLAPQVAARLVSVLARAIDHAHRQGIIHRDLKPANLLLLRADEDVCDCKVADFGLAKATHPDGAAQPPTAAVLGTPSYMAPEQAGSRWQEIGLRTDVYALGAILYESLTGRPPLQGDSPLETLEQVLTLDPVPPSRLQPKTPRDLETICLKCLAKEPARRYTTAAALADDLDRHLSGQPILARRAGPLERAVKWSRRRPAVALLLAALALTVVVSFAAVTAAWRSAVAALADKEAARRDEADARERAEANLADKLIALADLAWKNNDSAKAREQLAEVPIPRRTDRWFALQRACTAQQWSWQVESILTDVAFDPAGKLAAATTENGKVVVWDVLTGAERMQSYRPRRSASFAALAFTPDASQLVRAYLRSSSTKTGVPDLLEWQSIDLATGKSLEQQTIRGNYGTVRLGNHGQFVLANDRSSSELCVWNVLNGEQVLRLHLPYDFSDAAFTSDGERIIAPEYDGGIRTWKLKDGQRLQQWEGGSTGYAPLAINPTGKHVVLALHGNVLQVPLQVRDVASGAIVATINTPHNQINDVAIHPSGNWVASVGPDGLAVVWDSASGEEVLTLRGHVNSVDTIEFSPDGRHLLTGGRDCTVRLWKFLPPEDGR